MFNPLTTMIAMSVVILGISIWAMATQEGEDEDRESEDYSYFATKEQQQAREESDRFRHAA